MDCLKRKKEAKMAKGKDLWIQGVFFSWPNFQVAVIYRTTFSAIFRPTKKANCYSGEIELDSGEFTVSEIIFGGERLRFRLVNEEKMISADVDLRRLGSDQEGYYFEGQCAGVKKWEGMKDMKFKSKVRCVINQMPATFWDKE